ncbi:MAG: type II secretion system protein [Clostridium chrysemydis]|uniref:type II secretion system protein n=1 Tax=Clostridium chrysemydis TaxID=2665504 RepID=UPI003F3A57D8
MVKKIISTKKGYSLVEVVASLAIISILLVAVTQIIITSKKSEDNTNMKITNATVLNDVNNILFSLDNKGIDMFLNKNITLECTSSNDITEMILNGLKEPYAIYTSGNRYYTKNQSEKNKIKYIINIKINKMKQDPKNPSNCLYKAFVKVVGLKKPLEFYYNGDTNSNIDLSNDKEKIIDEDYIILRPNS